ncbi:type II secretion system F family protein [Cryobacterium sp. PAMC25264]|uniref:type II secretion system F family protein n=1 Tax=Cryobacterium sp. PAMC25264 TaxID=2861288 RepID=UPI001C63643D|nr:type II secretion system F family protein [Cryobacterium sp. PAMC25264]QYF74145.1 type II secretion system F family protein [Cryobacterium sp. PAMC25264]
MILVLGSLLGAGLVLLSAPFLWPSTRAGRRGNRLTDGWRARLAQAGMGGLPLSVFATVSWVLAVAAAALAEAILGVRALTVVAGVLWLILPSLIVLWRARARRRLNRTVWPDVVDHLVSAVRSGLALPDAVSSLAQSGPVLTRVSFAEFERDYRATGNFGYSVDKLKSSLADPFADRLLETLRMAREVGGSDLTVVLRSLSSWLRQDAAVRAEVEAKQSWVVNAARLGVAAPWIVLVLISTRPEAAQAFNTAAGTVVILGGLTVSVLAYRVMLALGRLPEERRWFQ